MKAPVPSRRAIVALAWLVAVVVLLALVWLAGRVASLDEENRGFEKRDEQSLADRRALAERLDREEAAMQALAEQLRQLGEKPVVEPSDPPEPGQIVPIPGPRGLSCIEEIGYPRCRGDQGRAGAGGADGNDGTPGADGKDGVDGKDGAPGADGRDGVDGKDGRGIEDAKCGDDGRWTLWWTDGTTSDGGPCLIAPGNSGAKQ